MMQFISSTGRRYGLLTRADLHDPLRSIDAAARYVSDLNAIFDGRIDLVLAGYNAGENAVIRSGYKVPRYEETRKYVTHGMSVLRSIIASNTLFSKTPQSNLKVSQTTASVINRGVTARHQFRTGSRPSRSIYFRLP
jgi:hypothetical protein